VTYTDTHCHLNNPPMGADPDAVLQRARDRDVTTVVVPAYDFASWQSVAALSGFPGVHTAFGIHPWVAGDREWGPGGLRLALGDWLDAQSSRPVAIGEIGLDSLVASPDLATQQAVLDIQLALAVEMDLPVILHCRGPFADLVKAVNRFDGKLRGVLHAFTRGPELVQQIHGAGLMFGLGGGITRDRARRVRRGLKVIPLDRIVLETDAPSIGLEGVSPQQVEPHHVADIAASLAAQRGESLETIARATTENAARLFSLP